jgi:hypothetical protein
VLMIEMYELLVDGVWRRGAEGSVQSMNGEREVRIV